MKRATSMQLFFSLLLALLPQLATDALAQAALKPGDRVEVDIIMAGAPERAIWRLGSISKIEKGEYFIRLDNGEERSLPIRPDKHWVRASQAPVPAPGTDALAQAALKPGTRVEMDIIMAGAPERALWRLGSISKIEKGEYFIRLDNGEERSLPIRPDKHWVRASQAPVPAPAPAPTAAPKPAVTTPTPPAAPQPKPASAPTRDSKEETDPALKPPGLGAPPNGTYNCQKIGQTYMGLGPLEIRGKTYRGIGKDGGFHPFTVDAAGQITWSAGIAGLPKGWTIRSSYFAGKDAKGRPLIKIYYRSASGFNDLIDCVRE